MTAHVWSPPAEIDATPGDAASAACDAGTSEPSPAASETSTAGTTNRRTSPRPTVVLADIVAVLSADAYRAWHDANTFSNPSDTEGKKITSRPAEHVGRRHSGSAGGLRLGGLQRQQFGTLGQHVISGGGAAQPPAHPRRGVYPRPPRVHPARRQPAQVTGGCDALGRPGIPPVLVHRDAHHLACPQRYPAVAIRREVQ